MKVTFYCCAFLLFVLGGLPVNSLAQEKGKYEKKGFCENYNYSSDNKVLFNELRETTVAAGGTINVDARRNGGVRVRGENRNDVLVRACVQTWSTTDETARALARNIRIETGSTIRAEGGADETGWSVSYELLVPRQSNLKLTAHNGGISIAGVEGAMEFETTNGGLHLSDLAGDVKGRTTNGGVHVTLSGNGWKGSGLDLVTTNGGVHVSLPENYAARFETGTTNGGYKSDIAALAVEKPAKENNWRRPSRVTADLNGGGAPVRIFTTNGGVKISTSGGREL
jgi:hypothetical protein